MSKQFLLAHRGYSSIAPENTKLAFDLAYFYGFDGVEVDVHLTKDNQLVIIHDETTGRTAKENLKISEATLKQLKKLDYGKTFKVPVPEQEILTLEEFLDLFIDKFTTINIEIKTDLVQYPNIENHIHELMQIKYKDKLQKLIFSSFNFKSLEIMSQLSKEYLLGFLYWRQKDFKKISKEKIQSICKYLHPWTKLYKKYAKEYQQYNMPFLLWTLKSKKEFKNFQKDSKILAQISNYKY